MNIDNLSTEIFLNKKYSYFNKEIKKMRNSANDSHFKQIFYKNTMKSINDTIKQAKDFISKLEQLNNKTYNNFTNLVDMSTNIVPEIDKNYFHNGIGGLIEHDEITKKKINAINTSKLINIGPLSDCKIELKNVSKLEFINPMFKIYNNKIYCRLIDNVFSEVSFPNINTIGKKDKSIKCKYDTVRNCNINRCKISHIEIKHLKPCNYAHIGERISKILYLNRCPQLPEFGNYETLNEDINIIDDYSIRNILMYSLHDLILICYYLRKKGISNHIYENLDLI